MKKAVLLLSGGLDSATTLAFALEQGFELYALTIFYGQRNQIELKSAQKIAEHFNVYHKFLDLDLRFFGASALTDAIDVKAHEEQDPAVVPNTYVPARNTIMLSLALAYAEVHNADHIYYGANAYDYSGYPDCRPAYIEAFEKMANLAIKSATEGGRPLKIHAPLVNLTKAEIIKMGVALKVPYELTHSCYNPKLDKACGHCSACFYRKKGFSEAGVLDPTRYEESFLHI